MKFDARTGDRSQSARMEVRRPDGTLVDKAFAFDTDEGWVDAFEVDGEGRPLMTPWKGRPDGGVQRDFVTKRIADDFDVVDKATGMVLASHRAQKAEA